MKEDEYELVYISDGSGKNKLDKTKKSKEKKNVEIIPSETTLKMRIEKKGRGGKAVTVFYEFPDNPPYFKRLMKELKNLCATGGSYKDTTFEIQGDQREKLRSYLEQKGFQVKG
ncbi:translation initiation factor [Halobacteriovorax sp. HLS]|uniref:translation initiation factor n=1 Tax=Halobacteriovorax sp. HLS TaxID=2234000 RepID=UPI0013E3B09B|nr:translation initiation factor [Halobacteriovorax sp. HLS]